jgi:acyl-CoA carboxylase subunit beta
MDRANAVTSRRHAPRRRLQAPGPELRPTAPTAGTIACPQCQRRFVAERYAADLNVCSECGHHGVVGAAQRIEQLADPGTAETLALDVGDRDPLGFDDGVPYPQRVARAREKTGLHEAFLVARASIECNPVVLACMDFAFLGGSLGSGAGEIFARGCEIAVAEDRALIAVCTSGGARMQEGIASLAQMARCSAAVVEVIAARLPYISVLGDPCFGGVTASFAVQSDVIIAEPGARIGFAGGRVIEQATHDKLPDGFQTAEFLLAHGMVDMVVARGHLRATAGTLIRIYSGRA